jgi:Zn-dependent M28 family amino/carboxypeptidase
MTKKTLLLIIPIILTIITFLLLADNKAKTASDIKFNAERAYGDVVKQVGFGPRIPGSEGHREVVEWIEGELIESGWQVEEQNGEYSGFPVRNIIGKYGSGKPLIILGAHYDTRKFADRDTDLSRRTQPVPGANDGASGVAVLLELARNISEYSKSHGYVENSFQANQVWLVFFDAEDNGKISGMDWAMGSQLFVNELKIIPESVIIVDMIGDRDLKLCWEGNSDQKLLAEIWSHAEKLYYGENFDANDECFIIDDHTAFINAGIAAVDLIDIDYPFWHTTHDTVDKVSSRSLKVIGDTLLSWLLSERE